MLGSTYPGPREGARLEDLCLVAPLRPVFSCVQTVMNNPDRNHVKQLLIQGSIIS